MRKNKKSLMVIALSLAMMMGISGCAKKAEPVATINGVVLTEDTYKAYLFFAKMSFEQISGPEIWDIEMDGQTMEQVVKERALESAVAMSVTSAKAKEMKVELDAEEKEYAKKSANEFAMQSTEKLKEEGITEDTIRAMMEEMMLSQKVYGELANKFEPTEDEEGLKQFIEENETYFEQVTAQHVLINTVDEANNPLPEEKQKEAKVKAEGILKRALAGEDMGALAKEFSEDPGSKDKNGEYTFPRGQMMPTFEEAAFTGEEGKVYPELVETPYGYHIVKTVKKVEANKDEMKKAFEENQKSSYVNGEVDEWVKSAKVEKTELYDTITIKRAEVEKADDTVTEQKDGEEVKTEK